MDGEVRNEMKEEKDIEREQLEWQIDQIRLRKQYAGTPAGFCDKEEELAAVTQWQADWEAWEEQQNHLMICEYRPEPELFAGRRRELDQISEALRRQCKRPVILYGMAGAGKSALVREWIRLHHMEYEHVIMLQFEESFCNTVCSDVILPMNGIRYQKNRYGSEREYFRIKIKLLDEVVKKENTLIVIDGYNLLRDRDMKRMFSQECDLIITTRLDPALWGYEGIIVDALQPEEEWQEFAALCGEIKSRDMMCFLQEQKNRYHGHMLRILLSIREKQGKSAEGELHAFEESMLMSLPLTQKERAALSFLAVMPHQRISLKLFRQISGFTDRQLERLTRFLLVSRIRENAGDEMIEMHPVAADAVKHLIPPTSPACAKMIRGLAELTRDMLWKGQAAEACEPEPYIQAVLRAFPAPAAYLAEPFCDMCRYLWHRGFAQEAHGYLLQIFDSVKNYFGEIHQMTGQAALQVAELYYQEEKWENARNWYDKGLNILENSRPVNRVYYQSLGLACCRIAGILRNENRPDEAANYLNRAEAYLKHYRVAPADTDYYFLLRQSIALEKVWDLIREGKPEMAGRMCQEEIEAAKQRFGEHARVEAWRDAMMKTK